MLTISLKSVILFCDFTFSMYCKCNYVDVNMRFQRDIHRKLVIKRNGTFRGSEGKYASPTIFDVAG